jgi:hypothetical protein
MFAICLEFVDISGLQALGALDDIEGDLLALFQGLETIPLDCRKVHKNVFTILLLDETKPLAIIEPLYHTF